MSLIDRLKALEVNQDGDTEQQFEHFEAGTDIIEIWRWVEDNHPEINMFEIVLQC